MQQRRITHPAVEIRNLHFSYGDLQVLRGLSLSIPRGEVVAILGGSGSGKSTLLKLIGGQLRPEQGIGLNKILGTIHIYPTFAEANKYAAGVWKKAHAPEGVLRKLERLHAWMRG